MYTPTKHVVERYIKRVLKEDIESFDYNSRGMDIVHDINRMIFSNDYAYGSVKDNIMYFLSDGYCIVVEGVNITTIYELRTDFPSDSEQHKTQVELLLQAMKKLDAKRLEAKVAGDIPTMYQMTDRLEEMKVFFLTPKGAGNLNQKDGE